MDRAHTSIDACSDAFALRPGDSVVFAGDSITEAGRRPGPEGDLGDGYVRYISGLIAARWPAMSLHIRNVGVSGFTSRDLLQSWKGDVLDAPPQWVSLLVGINDCNRHLQGDDRGVGPGEYASNCRELIGSAIDAGVRVVVVDPFYMWPAEERSGPESTLLDHLSHYVSAVGALAGELGLPRVTAHRAFARQLAHRRPAELGPEPIHPGVEGHLVLAWEWLRAMGW